MVASGVFLPMVKYYFSWIKLVVINGTVNFLVMTVELSDFLGSLPGKPAHFGFNYFLVSPD